MVGIIVPPRLLNHGVGKWNAPFVTRGEIIFPSLVASPLVKGNIPSLPLFLKGISHFQKYKAKVCRTNGSKDTADSLMGLIWVISGDATSDTNATIDF